VQDALHRALRNEPQLGWAHQLAFEPGIAVRYGERINRERALGVGRMARLGLAWGATAGNVRAALHAGIDGRLGLRGRLSWVPQEPEVEQPMRLYMLAGYRHDVVLRDLFVDGNTSRTSARAVRRAAVGHYELGLGMRWRGYGTEYRHVSRGEEYRAQPGRHTYGVLVTSLHQF
jgi:hypothetical protein